MTDWLQEIKRASDREEKWRKRAKKVVERYRDEREDSGSKFNILWANTETQRPALLSATPKPDVRRRYRDEDPVGKAVSEVLERALEFSADEYDFDKLGQRLVTDVLLPGRAIGRVRYVPIMGLGEQPKIRPEEVRDDFGEVTGYRDGEDLDDSVIQRDDLGPFYLGEPEEEVVSEEVRCEYVDWELYRQAPASEWGRVNWIAFGSDMTEKELDEAFPGKDIKLTIKDESRDKDPSKARVWEVWDKDAREVVFVSEGYDGDIDRLDDPLNLKEFYPIPEPLLSTETNGDMTPIPEFTLYQDQADELDRITARIEKITEAIKATGWYPGSQKAVLEQAFKSSDNRLVAVEDWAGFAEKGGANMISWVPVDQLAKVVSVLYAKREELLNTIYQLTGLSDIQRGATDARETKGAQQLKAQFGSRRLLPKQNRVQVFMRDLYRLKAELISENFSADTLQKMTGLEVSDDMMALMRDDHLRDFRIDIETDSTVAPDESQDKQDAVDFMQGVGSFASMLAQAGIPPQQGIPILMPVVRRFKFGREVEDHLKKLGEAKPPPNPEAEKMKVEAEQRQAEFKMRQQEQQADLAFKREELALKREELQMKLQARKAEIELKRQEMAGRANLDARIAEGEQLLKGRESEHAAALRERESQQKMSQESARAQQKRQHDADKHAQWLEQQRQSARQDAKRKDGESAAKVSAHNQVQARAADEAVRVQVEVEGKVESQVAAKLDEVLTKLDKKKPKKLKFTRNEDGSLEAQEIG
jgi:hypothetical protein